MEAVAVTAVVVSFVVTVTNCVVGVAVDVTAEGGRVVVAGLVVVEVAVAALAVVGFIIAAAGCVVVTVADAVAVVAEGGCVVVMGLVVAEAAVVVVAALVLGASDASAASPGSVDSPAKTGSARVCEAEAPELNSTTGAATSVDGLSGVTTPIKTRAPTTETTQNHQRL